MKHWRRITESNSLGQIYSDPQIVAYRRVKSLKDLLVRAKIQHFGVINGKGQVTLSQNLHVVFFLLRLY